MQYQSFSRLVPDAIVGPKTWAALEALVAQVLGALGGPPQAQPPGDGLGAKVVAAAEAALRQETAYFLGPVSAAA